MSITNTEGYFVKYTSLVNENNLADAFANQQESIKQFCASITEEKSLYAYAEGKWTLKEMLQHLIDTERVFAYRALAIARKDTTTLPSFDENEYAANSNANARTWESLTNEMVAVRNTTEMLFKSFSAEMLASTGKFSSNTSDVETLGLIIIGHFYHHANVVKERYM
jgi:DinB superfamily